MARSIIAVVAGLIVGGLLVSGVEYLAQLVYPPPPDLDLSDMDAVRAFAAAAPNRARLIVMLAWFVGPFGGAGVAAYLAQRSRRGHALIVGGVFVAADLINLVTIPSPVWMWVGGLIAPLLAAHLAGLLVKKSGWGIEED